MKPKKKGSRGKYRGSRKQMERQDREIIDTAKAQERDQNSKGSDCWQSSHNDPAWYAQNPQLLQDYANFPYGVPLGTPVSPLGYLAVPGVMALYFGPCVGSLDGESSALNIAARKLYSWVRHANSGHANYESPDLMMYCLAMDSAYMYLAFLQRLYGVMNYYVPLNRYVPRTLVTAMGVDFDDILVNLNDLRGYINNYALRLSSMAIPNSMSYMARHAWMCSGLYTDSSASKAQIYLYVPTSFYQYTNTGVGQVGSLNRVHFFEADAPTLTYNTYADLVKFGNDLLNPIITTEALNIMSGDIIKAYGMGGIVTPTTIPDNYIVLPTFNQEVLSQFENATMLGRISGGIAQNTSVGGGYLVSGEQFTRTFQSGGTLSAAEWNDAIAPFATSITGGTRLINMHHDGVTPADTMVATRVTNLYSGHANGFNTTKGSLPFLSTTVGSEAVELARVFAINASGALYTYRYYSVNMTPISVNASTGQVATALAQAITQNYAYSAFDWAPMIAWGTYNYDAPTAGAVNPVMGSGLLADFDNFTVLSAENLRNLSRTALLSEFWVPDRG